MRDILSKFKNGQKLWHESVVFEHLIDAMCRGLSEYDAIEYLVNMIESKQKEDIEALKKSNFPTMTIQCNGRIIGCPLKDKK